MDSECIKSLNSFFHRNLVYPAVLGIAFRHRIFHQNRFQIFFGLYWISGFRIFHRTPADEENFNIYCNSTLFGRRFCYRAGNFCRNPGRFHLRRILLQIPYAQRRGGFCRNFSFFQIFKNVQQRRSQFLKTHPENTATEFTFLIFSY